MATRSASAKQPARKTAVAKTAAKRPASKRAAAAPKSKARKPPVAALAGDAVSLRDLVTRLGRIELAGLAGRLVQGWRKDLEVIVEASQHSYAGLQAIVSRQTAQIKEAVGELQTVGTVMRAVGTKQSVRNLDDLALASLNLALADIRELADLAATSQREAYDLMQKRVSENIDEVQRLLHN